MQRAGSDILPRALRGLDRSCCECRALLVRLGAQASLCYVEHSTDPNHRFGAVESSTRYEEFYEDLARQNIIARLFQPQLGFRHRRKWVSVWWHRGFSHRRSVPRPLFRTLHGLLRYHRSSALFRPVCLSSTCLYITCLSITFLSI